MQRAVVALRGVLAIPAASLSLALPNAGVLPEDSQARQSYDLTAEHLEDFATMAGMEFLLIDKDTQLAAFKKELRWNDLYYHLAKGI